MIEVREERQDELDLLRAAGLQREAIIAEVREVTLAEVTKMRSERNSAAARHHELFVCIRRIVEACKKRKDKAPETLAKFRKVYEEWRKVRVEAHVVKWGELRERVASLTRDLEIQTLELQAMFGLASEASRLRQKLSEVLKEVDEQRAKLASLGQGVEEVSRIREDVSKF